jgi:hypothetical protein
LAKDQKGRSHHYYDGAVIEWLNDKQRSQWLADGLVEELGTPQIEAIDLAEHRRQQRADKAEAERVRQCISVLDDLELPLSAGAPRARAAVRARGHQFGNDTIATAVKRRRELSQSRTPGMPAWPVSEEMARP